MVPRDLAPKDEEPKIEIVEVKTESEAVYDFDDDSAQPSVAIGSPKKEIKGLEGLIGEKGYGQYVSVYRQSEWHDAKVIAPPKTGSKATSNGPRKIFVHYKVSAKENLQKI